MKAISHEEAESIRRYLIGDLGEDEMESFEQRVLSDPDFLEQVLMAEDELIEDYLRGALPAGEREKFVAQYLSAPQHLQKVKVAEALRGYPERVANAAINSGLKPEPRLTRRRFGLARAPGVVYALAATLLIAALVGLWVFMGNRRARPGESAALEQELARLNAPETRRPGAAPDPNEIAVTLSPGTVRGQNELPRVSIPGSATVVNFRLELLADNHPTYRVALRTDARGEVFAWSGLRDQPAGADFITLRVPARVLAPGDYVLALSGSNPAGDWQEVTSYSFRVSPGR